MLTKKERAQLECFAAQIRLKTIESICAAGSGHVGGAMSMVEALAVLYGKVMHIDPTKPRLADRSRFVLSKGHSGPSLYATLALCGFFPEDVLLTLNHGDTIIPSHCDRNKTPGVDFSTGSLGQGLSLAAGSALGARAMGKSYTSYCILGDGEMDEGQIWECILFSAHHKLSNLVALVDYNKQQLDGKVDDICRLGDLREKFEAFGWFAQDVDGHDVGAVYEALMCAQEEKERPCAIVLHTEKGHGCSYALAQPICHHLPMKREDCQADLDRLQAEIETLQAKIKEAE